MLITLDAAARRLVHRSYPASRFKEAVTDHLELEERREGSRASRCVSSRPIPPTPCASHAYPNSLLDVGLFLDSLRLFLGRPPASA